MRAKIILAGVSIAALLGATACTTTDPYSSTPRRNTTGTGVIAGARGGAVKLVEQPRSSERASDRSY